MLTQRIRHQVLRLIQSFDSPVMQGAAPGGALIRTGNEEPVALHAHTVSLASLGNLADVGQLTAVVHDRDRLRGQRRGV